MSLAKQLLARKLAGEKFDFAARKAALLKGEAGQGSTDVSTDQVSAASDAAPVPPKPFTRRQPTLGQRHAMKTAARNAANDNIERDLASADLTPYDQMLVKLYADKASLKLIQSTEGKVAMKRQLIPDYHAWVLGKLEAAADGARGVQDDVLVAVMIWSIDIGDYKLALELAEYCRRYDLVLPRNINRDLANFVTEEIAETALKAYRAGGDAAAAFPGSILGDVEELFREDDMFDQVRAKLQKAIGQAILAAAPADASPDQLAPIWRDALGFFQRAADLDSASGCVKLIEKLTRDLKKLNPGDPDAS